jgi:hypothetical protein
MRAEGAIDIQTPNSVGKLKQGEIIYSFDDYYNRSQVMVIQGAMTFANILEEELRYEVTAGKFSILENKLNDGIPRQPTSVGKESFGRVVAIFDNVQPNKKSSRPLMNKALASQMVKSLPSKKVARTIASIGSTAKRGKVIFINSPIKMIKRNPASATTASDYFNNMEKKKVKPVVKKSGKHVNIRIFGASYTAIKSVDKKTVSVVKKRERRMPASIPTQVSEKTQLVQELRRSSPFQKSLKTQVQNQQRHSQERNMLIDELKSFNQEYKKEY